MLSDIHSAESPRRVNGARLEFPNPHGLPRFALHPGSKEPLRKEFWRDASPDAEIPPGHNAGVPAGRGLIVLDLDVKNGKDGRKTLAALQAIHDSLPPTFTVSTPSGGEHRYFRDPRGRDFGQGTDRLGSGVDLKAHPHGYVVAAGSRADGGVYEITDGREPAEAPQWLIAELLRTAPKARAPVDQGPLVELDTEENIRLAVEWLVNEAPEAIQGARGDDTTAKVIAPKLKDFGLSPDMAVEVALEHWNDTKAIPPWDPGDLDMKIRSGYRSATGNPPGIAIAQLAKNEFPALPEDEIARIERSRPERPGAVAAPAATGGVPLTLLGDLRERDVDWVVDSLLPVGGLGVLYGRPGSYKSFIALFLAAMIAEGRPVFGRRVLQAGPVVYVAAEGAHGLKKRTDALMKVHALERGAPIAFADKMLNLRSSFADCDALAASIAALDWRPALIVVDTLARTFAGGNENAPDDMGAFVDVITRLQKTTGATVLVVHHSGKDAAKGSRGHSSLLAAVDSEFEAEKVRDAPAEGEGTGFGRLKVTKQKDAPAGYYLDYAVEKVTFPCAARGADWADAGASERSSLAVRELRRGEAAGPQESALKKEQRDLLSIIRAIAPNGTAVARKRITDAAREAEWFRAGPDESLSSTERARLSRTIAALCDGYLEKTPAGEFALSSLALGDTLDAENAA